MCTQNGESESMPAIRSAIHILHLTVLPVLSSTTCAYLRDLCPPDPARARQTTTRQTRLLECLDDRGEEVDSGTCGGAQVFALKLWTKLRSKLGPVALAIHQAQYVIYGPEKGAGQSDCVSWIGNFA